MQEKSRSLHKCKVFEEKVCACVCKYTETSESSIALHRLTTYGALFLFVKPCNSVHLFGLIKMVPPKLAPAFELHFYPENNLSSLHAPQRRTKIRSFLFCGCYLFVPIFESRNSINNFIKTYIGRNYSNLLHLILNYLRFGSFPSLYCSLFFQEPQVELS